MATCFARPSTSSYFQVADTLDAAVVINEAVEIAKAYGTDESAGFVNGVLGRIVRDRHLPSLQHVACTVTAEDAEAACLAALWFEIDPKRLAGRDEAAARRRGGARPLRGRRRTALPRTTLTAIF
ncbi:MAG: transcription antitermination protein NusB [Collinsella sp.]